MFTTLMTNGGAFVLIAIVAGITAIVISSSANRTARLSKSLEAETQRRRDAAEAKQIEHRK